MCCQEWSESLWEKVPSLFLGDVSRHFRNHPLKSYGFDQLLQRNEHSCSRLSKLEIYDIRYAADNKHIIYSLIFRNNNLASFTWDARLDGVSLEVFSFSDCLGSLRNLRELNLRQTPLFLEDHEVLVDAILNNMPHLRTLRSIEALGIDVDYSESGEDLTFASAQRLISGLTKLTELCFDIGIGPDSSLSFSHLTRLTTLVHSAARVTQASNFKKLLLQYKDLSPPLLSSAYPKVMRLSEFREWHADDSFTTPLHEWLWSRQGSLQANHPQFLQAWLEMGYSPNAVDSSGVSLLMVATTVRGEMLSLLLAARADPFHRASGLSNMSALGYSVGRPGFDTLLPLYVDQAKKTGDTSLFYDSHGNNFLHMHASSAYVRECYNKMFSAGLGEHVQPNARNNRGETPLLRIQHRCLSSRYAERAHLLEMLQLGCDPLAVDPFGRSVFARLLRLHMKHNFVQFAIVLMNRIQDYRQLQMIWREKDGKTFLMRVAELAPIPAKNDAFYPEFDRILGLLTVDELNAVDAAGDSALIYACRAARHHYSQSGYMLRFLLMTSCRSSAFDIKLCDRLLFWLCRLSDVSLIPYVLERYEDNILSSLISILTLD